MLLLRRWGEDFRSIFEKEIQSDHVCFLDGYVFFLKKVSAALQCSNEGRGMMMVDFQVLTNKVNRFSSSPPGFLTVLHFCVSVQSARVQIMHY